MEIPRAIDQVYSDFRMSAKDRERMQEIEADEWGRPVDSTLLRLFPLTSAMHRRLAAVRILTVADLRETEQSEVEELLGRDRYPLLLDILSCCNVDVDRFGHAG